MASQFTFFVRDILPLGLPGPMRAYLVTDRWDDWGKYRTQFRLFVFDENGAKHEIGDVKIGQENLRAGISTEEKPGKTRSPAVPDKFYELGDNFFSLGQAEDYYEKLARLSEGIRAHVINGLRDVVASTEHWKRFVDEDVMTESLLRGIRVKTVEVQYRRLLSGGARLTDFSFSYEYPKRSGKDSTPLTLSFKVKHESIPPSNIHVIIGRNGVGKTHALHLMTKALIAEKSVASQSGRFLSGEDDPNDDGIPFANLVSVSFSAFDEFESFPKQRGHKAGLQYSYIGLKRQSEDGKIPTAPKSPAMLTGEFVKSARACTTGVRLARWNRLLRILEADPLFKAAQVASTLAETDELLTPFDDEAKKIFRRLSSGHKIVLLSIARLVETVDEKTLVLLDEPEAHLHPPLLSAFVRALSDLLINRNGVAIIATHSPVILQEVPLDCVWKLTRTGSRSDAKRPKIETFGENVGILTREIFGLEVINAGFHQLLKAASESCETYEEALEYFSDKLGGEGRAILRSMFNRKLQK